MAHYTYDIQLDKACPRCGSTTAIVGVFHFGATHQPRCKGCGLNDGKGECAELAKSIMTNCFYEYDTTQARACGS